MKLNPVRANIENVHFVISKTAEPISMGFSLRIRVFPRLLFYVGIGSLTYAFCLFKSCLGDTKTQIKKKNNKNITTNG